MMELSQYQEAILNAVRQRTNTSYHADLQGILIEALAGTGKSFTLVEACQVLADAGVSPEEIRLVVFGRKNKADLQAKLEIRCGSDWRNSVCTLNSLSFQILKEATGIPNSAWKVESNKYTKIARELGYISHFEFSKGKRNLIPGSLFELDNLPAGLDLQSLSREFEELLDKFRLYCLDVNFENLKYFYDLHRLEMQYSGLDNLILKALNKCLKRGYEAAIRFHHIDFIDQSWILWAGVKEIFAENEKELFFAALAAWRKELFFIAVDEAQDTDMLQINLLLQLIDPQHNFLCAVGDRYQAVYSFRGCLSDGLDKFQQTFNCESFLLPVNYRCARSHLRLVREIFSHIPIEPHSEAIEGEVKIVKSANFLELFADRSLSYIGVCRKNAPLITTALLLLAQGLPVKIKDSSLAKKICLEVEKICKKLNQSYEDNWQIFPTLVAQYEEIERRRLLNLEDGEARLANLNDMLAAILALYEVYEPQSIQQWEGAINKIFDESEGQAINLYSIHSGKGGEADIAFIINAENIPLIHKKQTPEERQQENNLLYVALTRAKKTLALVLGEDKNPSDISWLPQKYFETAIEQAVETSPGVETEDDWEYIKYAGAEPLASILPDASEVAQVAQELACPSCGFVHEPFQNPLCGYGKEVTQEELIELLATIEDLKRPQLRTIFRELVDRLGKETIADLLK